MSQQLGEPTMIEHIGITVAEGDADNNNGRTDLSPMIARYVYLVILVLGCTFAWAVRDNHIGTFFEAQRLKGCHGNRDCLTTEAILIISLALFLFFMTMFFSTVYTKKVHDPRNAWHAQWWLPKIILLAICLVISTMAPSYVIQLYGKIAPFGAGLFIFVQLMSAMRYITRLNYKWCLTNMEECYLRVILFSIVGYSVSIVGTILMRLWYAGCWQNKTFIVVTPLLVLLMFIISMISKANGFYMEPALLGAYISFLCYSAIKSEPETGCYKKEISSWKTIVSFIGALISIAVAAFSTGKDYKCLQFRNVPVSAHDDVPYGYGFFHFVFAMGSMYFGMMFVGWDTHHISETWSMDAGWTSTWVHLGNEGLVVIFFVSILLARIYNIEWLRQILDRSFGNGGQQGGESQSTELGNVGQQGGESRSTEVEMNTGPPPSPLSLTTTDLQIAALSSNNNSEAATPPSS